VARWSAFRTVSQCARFCAWSARGPDSDAELGAKERGTEFGNELFDGVGFTAKALGQVAIAAVGGSGPMHQLVQQGAARRSA
jgi:hypothetical protein